MKKIALTFALTATLSSGMVATSQACTSAIYNHGSASLSVRTMDWFGHDDAVVVGVGSGIETRYADTKEGLTAHSKYAALKIKSFGPQIVAEAMNDQGLVARILYLGLDYTKMAPEREGIPDVAASKFPSYAVDNFASVKDVIDDLSGIDVIQDLVCDLPNHEGECIPAPVHYHLTDAHGDSAVIEFIDGEIKIYHGDVNTAPSAQYLSNDPEFSFHMNLDKEQTEAGSTIRAYDRRLRAKAILDDMYARDVSDNTQALNSMKAAGASVFAGYSQLDPYANDVFPTLWTIYTDQNAKEIVLDRYDTWQIERYNFDMFNNEQPKEVILGAHPRAKLNK
ncbi:linear amide C-N hydrolase [Vibrio sp. ZSDZ65]|uniref:Linear amide C-N hydrolase n=1 Tax=Vibrio qingdaonensis TaxID=2829491 RepID=A0A9X3HXM5_9VIBR|nr:linear amide C-N hydrolase [Vibrio qingdaonensis]MCW8347479.1 linear amide C-N hydrolase [Vibrio qingdaonensis]